jgi:hypothetical protein
MIPTLTPSMIMEDVDSSGDVVVGTQSPSFSNLGQQQNQSQGGGDNENDDHDTYEFVAFILWCTLLSVHFDAFFRNPVSLVCPSRSFPIIRQLCFLTFW